MRIVIIVIALFLITAPFVLYVIAKLRKLWPDLKYYKEEIQALGIFLSVTLGVILLVSQLL